MMLVWHSAASRNGEEQRFCKAVTSHAPPLCHVERSATTPWASLQNLKRAVETPREGFGLHSASGNFSDAAASENRLGARNRFPPYIPGLCATIAAIGSHWLTLRDTLWGEFLTATFLPQALSGCFDCAPIRLEAADFLQALRST
jgi:hypothetical protein